MFEHRIKFFDEERGEWLEISMDDIDNPEFANAIQLHQDELTIVLREASFFMMAQHTNDMAVKHCYLLN